MRCLDRVTSDQAMQISFTQSKWGPKNLVSVSDESGMEEIWSLLICSKMAGPVYIGREDDSAHRENSDGQPVLIHKSI